MPRPARAARSQGARSSGRANEQAAAAPRRRSARRSSAGSGWRSSPPTSCGSTADLSLDVRCSSAADPRGVVTSRTWSGLRDRPAAGGADARDVGALGFATSRTRPPTRATSPADDNDWAVAGARCARGVPKPRAALTRTTPRVDRRRGVQSRDRRAGRRRRWYGGVVPQTALTPAIRDEIARLGRADIMVGIPSFKNAATIGYVVRAAQAGLVQYFPGPATRPRQLRRRLARRHQRVVVETEPPDYVERILLVRPNRLDRVSLTYPEIDGVGGKGAALRTIFEIAAALEVQALVVVDSDLRSIVPEWIELLAGPDPQGRLRLRRAALRPLQVRRHDHQHRHLPADPGALRPPHPAADRRRLRRQRRPRPALPRAGRLDRRRQQVRHRHLDDDVGADRRLRGLPDPARREGPRPQGPGRRPRARCSARSSARSCAWPSARRPLARHPRLARRPGLRLRADHRPAAARGEHAPPAVEFHAGSLTLADTWRRCSPRPTSRRCWSSREAGRLGDRRARLGLGGDVAATSPRRRRDGRGGQRLPLPRRPVGARHLRPGRRHADPGESPRRRWSRRWSRSTSAGSAASSSRTAT